MTVSVGAYVLCDGTLENGVAISDLRINQTRSTDIVGVLPNRYRIQIQDLGTGYTAADLLSISDGGQLAAMTVTSVGGTGDITGFIVLSNTFTELEIALPATGGTGSGATFNVLTQATPNAASPKPFERYGRPCQYTFMVKRTHSSLEEAERFILALDNSIPAVGDIEFTTTGPGGSTDFVIPNGKVQSHELNDQMGQTTIHTYTIIGGSPVLA